MIRNKWEHESQKGRKADKILMCFGILQLKFY